MQKIIIGREYPQVVIPLIKNSKQSIDILIYDWRWYDCEVGSNIQKFNREIIFASSRGVRVRAIVNNDIIVSSFLSQVIFLKKTNLKNTLHVKMILIDSKFLVIGSHNLTKNAFEINHEISVLLDDQESITKCQSFFNHVI